jgi:hypothetical protein
MGTLQSALINAQLAQPTIQSVVEKRRQEPGISLSDVVVDLRNLKTWGEIPPKHPQSRYFLRGLSIDRISFKKGYVVCFHSYDHQLRDFKFDMSKFTPRNVFNVLSKHVYIPNSFGNGGNWV